MDALFPKPLLTDVAAGFDVSNVVGIVAFAIAVVLVAIAGRHL